MFALTWNIGGNLVARTALYQFLSARSDQGVVVVQEWVPPKKAQMPAHSVIDSEVRSQTANRFRLVCSASGRGRQVMLASDGLNATDEVRSDRLISATFASPKPAWRGLRVIGVHARSKLWATESVDRDYHVAMLVKELNAHWQPPGIPVLMLGDFNAAPYTDEITGSARLGACRERSEVLHHGFRAIDVDALYNPTWSLLPDAPNATDPAGTYFYGNSKRGVRWECLDQLMVSRELAASWKQSWNPKLVPVLSGHQSLRHGRPKTKRAKMAPLSDHVPLIAEIAVEDVSLCRI
jgi:endonuclease/exonuclease/phosphatase family metal-dependent hydrolase